MTTPEVPTFTVNEFAHVARDVQSFARQLRQPRGDAGDALVEAAALLETGTLTRDHASRVIFQCHKLVGQLRREGRFK